ETDSVGVLAFDQDAQWIRPLAPVGDKEQVQRRIAGIGAGGGTNMFPALVAARKALAAAQASIKHVILLTDGQSMPGDFAGEISTMTADQISVSTVAVGPDADVQLLRSLARGAGGRFYHTLHPRAVPGIFISETQIISRPQIFEDDAPWSPQIQYPSELVR